MIPLRTVRFAALIPLSAFALAAAFVPAGAQTTATTDPVGFISLTATGTHGGVSPALSFIGQGMTRPVEVQSSVTSVSGTSVTDSSASWTDDQFDVVTTNGVSTGNAYYLELTSGTGVGLWADIVSTNGATTAHTGTPNTVVLNADLSAYISAGTTYKIRKNWTLASIFGANPTAAGASGLAGGSASGADQVQVYTPAVYNNSGTLVTPGSYTTYYYKTAGLSGGTGWRSTASLSADASNAKFEPSSGILVRRFQSADTSFTLVGSVKTGTADLPISEGLNIVSNIFPTSSMTLGTSGLYNPSDPAGNTLVGGGAANAADQVLIYSNGAYSTYYYKNSGLSGGTGWRSTASLSADASGTVIPSGASILIQRSHKTLSPNGSFEWVAPQPF